MTVENRFGSSRERWNSARRDVLQSMRRGLFCKCPACGTGKIFGKFLKVNPTCEDCGLKLDGHQADDMPPYIVIMITGHIIVGLILTVEQHADWPMWLHYTVWPALVLFSAMVLLQPVKGALIGYQWALKMHGFDPGNRIPDPALPEKIPG